MCQTGVFDSRRRRTILKRDKCSKERKEERIEERIEERKEERKEGRTVGKGGKVNFNRH